jgi:peptidoglycan/xylan/chitin deacetylase (PgdA/CDA1 family)
MSLLAINHHYFREAGTGRGIYPTTPRALQDEVRELRRAGWRVGTEADILAYVAGELSDSDRVAILTFDDGLREQMDAISLLDDMGATAICYVPTAPLARLHVLDVHKLQMIRSHVEDTRIAEELDREFAFSKQEFDESALAIQYRYDDPLARRVKYFLNFMLEESVRVAWTASYFQDCFGDESAIADDLYMSPADLRELAGRHLLGSHAHSHVPLARLSVDRLEDELVRSRDFLEAQTAALPAGVSYPFGGKSAVGDEVFRMAAECGFRYGFTMERGINTVAGPECALSLKRIDINDLGSWLNPTK